MRIFLDDNTQREFQLPAGFYMELSRTNPFLTDEGSQSVPITLPPTDHNLRLVGALHRGVWTRRPVRRLLVRVQHGAVNMRGSLAIDSAHRKEGIGCTFYTSEGQLYETIGEKLLGDLEWPVDTIQGGISARISEMKSVMRGDNSKDYFVFPTITDNEFGQEKPGYGDKFIINDMFIASTSPLDIKFVGETPRKWITGEGDSRVEIDLPVGYGIDPFLKMSYILRFIFSQFGYTLRQNHFDTETSLSRLVLINNTADAICDNGTLYYKQLIPDKTKVMDFLNVIRTKFGLEFIEDGQFVKIGLWNDALMLLPDKDFSNSVDEDINIEFVDPKAIEIIMNRSLMPYSNIEGTADYDLFRKYGPQRIPVVNLVYEKGYTYFKPSLGNYYIAEKTGIAAWGAYISWISSSFWDKPNRTSHETESIEFKDVSVPMIAANSTVSGHTTAGEATFKLPYIGGIRNLNSNVTMNDNTVEYTEETTDLQLMMCFSVPYSQSAGSVLPPFAFPMGTSFIYSAYELSPWGSISLTVTGESNLYGRFYRLRDDMLQYANQIVKFNAILLPEEIATMDLSVPKIVNGIKILVERIDYILGQSDMCQVTARTVNRLIN